MSPRFGNVSRLPSGRYRARYYEDGTLKAAPETFQAKTDATAWLSNKQKDLATQAYRPAAVVKAERDALAAQDHLFGEYVTTRVAARKLKQTTRDGYEFLLSRYLQPAFGAVPLVSIDSLMVQHWYDRALSNPDGRFPGHTGRAKAYGLLKSVLSEAVAVGLIVNNPCSIRGGASAETVHETEIATMDELTTITAAMPERYRMLVQLACWCCLRQGEAIALTRSDVIILANGEMDIKVRRGAVEHRGKGRFTDTPKSRAGRRTVSVPRPVAEKLLAHMKKFTGPEPTALISPTPAGVMISRSGVTVQFKKARLVANRPDLHFHDLRHTGATWAAAGGATTKELMQRLGHTTATVAMRYQHASRTGDQRIAARLTEMMEPVR